MKLLLSKEPIVEFMEEELLNFADWLELLGTQKNNKYTILYRDEEKIYINPKAENSQEVFEIIPVLLKQKYLNKRTEKIFDKVEKLVDKKTYNYIFKIWHKWREKVIQMELHSQAENIIKQIKSKRLSSKARKNSEIIRELFDIGFGLYEEKRKIDYQKGAENAFLYGYMLGMEEHSSCI